MAADAAQASALDCQPKYQPPGSAPTDGIATNQSSAHLRGNPKSGVSAVVCNAAQSHARVQASMEDGRTLSPRVSLDLGLHPDSDEICVVRITADPQRAQYPEDDFKDSIIEDPTAVAFLEHAFQPNTTHPVFHVHMPSRRSSQHGQEAASEADSEADHEHQFAASAHSMHGDNQVSQPLLPSTPGMQSPRREGHVLSMWQSWKKLLGNPEAVPFFAMSLLMGFGTGTLSVYLFLYLDELGKDDITQC